MGVENVYSSGLIVKTEMKFKQKQSAPSGRIARLAGRIMNLKEIMSNHFPIFQALPPETYIVGGAVRDMLLGRSPADWDLASSGDLDLLARQLARKLNAHRIPLGRPGHSLVRLIAPRITLDLTPLEGANLNEDLRRRDFTINAMAWDPAQNQLRDPFKGLTDLEAAVVRRVTPQGFRKDPLRLLRAYRLAGQLQFSIAPTTRDQIRNEAFRISESAGERQQEEIFKLLVLPVSRPWVAAMAEDGLLSQVFPELAATRGCNQGKHHAWNVWDHTLAAFKHLEALLGESPWIETTKDARELPSQDWKPDPPLLKLALLLHDVGKPGNRAAGGNGEIHFYGHAGRGAQMARDICCRLRLSKARTGFIRHLISRHLDPLHLCQARQQGTLSPRGITRFFTRNHPWVRELLMHALADQQGKTATQPMDPPDFAEFAMGLRRRYENDFLVKRAHTPLLSGRDLIGALNLTPGPQFKWILSRVEEARLSGEIQTRQEALQLAAGLISKPTDESDPRSLP